MYHILSLMKYFSSIHHQFTLHAQTRALSPSIRRCHSSLLQGFSPSIRRRSFLLHRRRSSPRLPMSKKLCALSQPLLCSAVKHRGFRGGKASIPNKRDVMRREEKRREEKRRESSAGVIHIHRSPTRSSFEASHLIMIIFFPS
ncbi:uncharacterized protein LOC127745515 isoform X2 [Arachis duranensis]|nr:uncharacterized protein LOC127745515 isoform X2 [Arachis duranensis]